MNTDKKMEKENECVAERLFHEWIVSEWNFNSHNRDGLRMNFHPRIQEATRVICKFCLKQKKL